MTLAKNLLERNAGRPKTLTDFDLRPDLAYLVERSTSPDESVWTPSWWVNFTCLLIVSFLALILFLVMSGNETVLPKVAGYPAWLKILIGLASLVPAAIFMELAFCAVNRCRLVVDKFQSELRITYGLQFWRRYTLRFDDIRAVKSRSVENPGIDEGPGVPNRVVFAELFSGELVLLAIDPDWRKASLFREIELAVESSRHGIDATFDPPKQRLLLA